MTDRELLDWLKGASKPNEYAADDGQPDPWDTGGMEQTAGANVMRRTETIDPEIIGIVCDAIDRARAHITSEASWARLEEFFYQALTGRQTLSAAIVLAWAEAAPADNIGTRHFTKPRSEHIGAHRCKIFTNARLSR
jgi:hypothetical protein